MTGPEHYLEAERLLAVAASDLSANMIVQTGEDKADVLAAAQAHATLALVAATAVARTEWRGDGGASTYLADDDQWAKAVEFGRSTSTERES